MIDVINSDKSAMGVRVVVWCVRTVWCTCERESKGRASFFLFFFVFFVCVGF